MSDPKDYDFLQDEAPEIEQPAIEAEPVAEEVAETVDVAPETPAPEAPTAPESEPEVVPLAALKAEREKRQKYEAELRKYQQQAPQFDPQVFHQDPNTIREYVDSQLATARIGISRAMVAAANPDYEDMEALFVEAATANPILRDEMLRAENPALYAYQTAKTLQTVRDAQTGDLEKRLRSEIEAKVRAELAAKPRADVPPDLSNTRSGVRAEVAPPDDSLDSILKSRR